jgi:16S rRNA (guanine527-N7)-methyltransferase
LPQTDAAAAAAREVRHWLERLLDGAPTIAGTLPSGFADRAEAYAARLLRANQRLNLTRLTEPEEVATLHLLDALAAVHLLDQSGAATAVDLGSGGGLPGIPLALARPEVRWLLVDSVAKKASVLREFVEALGLGNVSVSAERAETLGRLPDHRERHELVAARACAPLPVLAELALPLLAPEGTLLAWKGPLADEDEELRVGRSAIGQLGGGRVRVLPVGLPALGGHTFVVAVKEGPTPARYPRRSGEPSRRPLS